MMLVAAERLRLRAHFALVARELRRSHRPNAAAREATIAELRRYARAGAFPLHGGRGGTRPVFVDHRGTRCAMAHLLEWSGQREMVQRIAAEQNYARLPEMEGRPGLPRAVHALGITPAEAARIQPAYYPTAWQCLLAFALQWLGAVAALFLGLRAIAYVRFRRAGRAGGRRLGGRRIALAAVLVLLGVASYSKTCPPEPPPDAFGKLSTDYAACGSAFSPGDVLARLREVAAGKTDWVTPRR